MTKKKQLILVIIVAVVAVALIVAVVFMRRGSSGSGGGDAAYVESVAEISGGASSGTVNRYAGVVESQDTWDVTVSQEQTVKEVLVAEGDEVSVGTPLLTYDTDEIALQLSQAKLELEESQNQVKDYNNQIKALETEKKSASSDEQFNYTVQIQSLETSIKQAEYDQQSKQMEIDKLQKSLDESTVTSEIAGVVKEINENGETDDNGNTKPYISILTAGDYRVKGMVNETNVYLLSEGQAVILRSRVDEDQIWTGTIQTIDTENAESSNSNVYYEDGTDGSAQSSKYPFYITLDSSDGLMLGQHLYIEADEGQTEAKDGIWIYSGYLIFDDADVSDSEVTDEDLSSEEMKVTEVETGDTAADDTAGEDASADVADVESTGEDVSVDTADAESAGEDVSVDTADAESTGEDASVDTDTADGDAESDVVEETISDSMAGQIAYVWADNGNGKLEKREVTLGSYNAEMDMYEITSGLTEDDYIAWPMNGFTEGMKTTTNLDDAMVEDVTTDEDVYTDEKMIDDSSVGEDGEVLDGGTVSKDGKVLDDGTTSEDGETSDDGTASGDGETVDDESGTSDGTETGDGASDAGTSEDASAEN